MLAGQLVDNERLNADCVEVSLLADGDLEFAHPSGRSPTARQTTILSRRAMNWPQRIYAGQLIAHLMQLRSGRV